MGRDRPARGVEPGVPLRDGVGRRDGMAGLLVDRTGVRPGRVRTARRAGPLRCGSSSDEAGAVPAPGLHLHRQPRSARLYATALGVYQASINGRPVSDNVLAPGWTNYHKRVLYQTYDITDLLVTGENVIGVVVADGWACGFYGFDAERPGRHYAPAPELLAQVVVTFSDGTEQRLVSDKHWQGTTGAIAYADLLMGERRDGRLEPKGWDRSGYDAAARHAVYCRDLGHALLRADPGPPIRVTEEVEAKSVRRVRAGEVMVDFGQNLVGWLGSRRTSRRAHSSACATARCWLATVAFTLRTCVRPAKLTCSRLRAARNGWSHASRSTASVTPR